MEKSIWFYDRYGAPTVILLEGMKFVDKQGNNLGYIKDGNKIYNYHGKHCGWIEGWVTRDLHGYSVAFCKYSNDAFTPIFPIPQISPIPAIPQIPPIPAIPQIPYMQPIKKFGWSNLLPLDIFK